MKKNVFRLLIIALAVILASSLFASCKLTEDEEEPEVLPGLTVVMTSKNVDITLYDFGQSYRSNDYYQYVTYGLIGAEDYCNYVIEDLSTFMYILNAAYDDGFELTADEYAEITDSINQQLEQILQGYESQLPEGTEDKRAEAIKLLNEDIVSEGVDYETLVELAIQNLCMYRLADKYYQSISSSVTVTEDDVKAYINELFINQRASSMSEFGANMNAYYSQGSPCPVYIPEDCFSVNHIFLEFNTLDSGDGKTVYDKTSKQEKEALIESLLPDADGFDGFMELVRLHGEDPGMSDDTYKENGYLIHGDLDKDYFPGFVYAAMNLHDGEWTPAEDAEYEIPELTYFTLKDGTRVVKVYSEMGVHYIIINKEYQKGRTEYEIGDAKWLSWETAVNDRKLDERFTELSEIWHQKYEINVDFDTIYKKFVTKTEN